MSTVSTSLESSSSTYGVRPDDPSIFATISVAIAGIALLASWIPALRASHLDPITALLDE
jgi:putative ABC transport system permease protein